MPRPKGIKNKKYSPEFKLSVIMDMRENNLSYCETVRKYELSIVSKTSPISTIQRWERIYLEEGVEGLMKERRGRATKLDNPKIGRSKKCKKPLEEDLIAENQRLRMENEYLKKLNALVQERIQRENGKKQ